MILSPYTFLFEEDQRHYVFNSESLFFSQIEQELYRVLSDRDFDKLSQENINILLEKKILIDPKDTHTYFNHVLTQYLTYAYSPDTMSLVIAPTTACNFDCPYCFELKRNPKVISQEVEDKIIEYINIQKHLHKVAITWYGGEPLLQIDKIKQLYDRIHNETEMEITNQEIVSNTSLIDDKTLEIMRHCGINRIQVSLDGSESNHNKTRFLKATNQPTFKLIEQNIEKMANALPDLHISIRVNINKNNWMDFVTIYNKYNDPGVTWHKNISVYPGILREDRADGRGLCKSSYTNSELTDLYIKLASEGVEVNMFPRHHVKGCMLQRTNTFIIGPEGELYKCWNDVSDPDKIIGSIMDDDRHNYDLLMKYMQECQPIREECRDCFVFPICDGGCGYLRYRNKFEKGEFELCTAYKDKEKLKKALLFSTKQSNNPTWRALSL